jgi:nitrogen fixation protein FixH
MIEKTQCRWIPWALAGALAVVVGENGALAYIAATTAPGLVTEHPFERGNDYNRVLDAGDVQDALGWRISLRLNAVAPGRGEVVAELADRSSRPLRGLGVTARLVRPLGPEPEIAVTLPEDAPGRYVQTIILDRPGQWDVRIAAQDGSTRFAFVRRMVVK